VKFRTFCLAAWLSCLGLSLASAQSVCVVDVASIFKSNQGFNQQLQALKSEAEQFKNYVQQKTAELQQLNEQLKTHDVDSPEYVQLESRIAQQNASLEVESRAKSREFVKREAKLHFETYLKTTNYIAQICDQRGTSLIVQFNSIPMDPSQPETVMQRVNSDIVYYAANRDITDDVVQLLNQSETRTSSRPNPQR